MLLRKNSALHFDLFCRRRHIKLFLIAVLQQVQLRIGSKKTKPKVKPKIKVNHIFYRQSNWKIKRTETKIFRIALKEKYDYTKKETLYHLKYSLKILPLKRNKSKYRVKRNNKISLVWTRKLKWGRYVYYVVCRSEITLIQKIISINEEVAVWKLD